MADIKAGIWFTGICSWVFGLTDRAIAASSDHVITATDLILLFTAALLFMGWLFLKPGD